MKITLAVTIEKELHDKLLVKTRELNCTKSYLIQKLLIEYFKELKNERKN